MPAKKKAAAKKKAPAKATTPKPAAVRSMDYGHLVTAIQSTSEQAVHRAAVAVNQWLVLRNWTVGAYLVEYEQNGSDRAKYGAKLLKRLAGDLAKKGVKGLGVSNLERCRACFWVYPQCAELIPYAVITELALTNQIPYAVTTESGSRQTLPIESGGPQMNAGIPATLSPESGGVEGSAPIRGTVPPELPTPLSPQLLLRLSWTKLQELLRIDDPWKRAFYENECLKSHWSVRQLQRQIETLLYERTALSTNKKSVIERARKQEPPESIEDLIRDPYILEFAGLAERPEYSENDLETALLDHLQRFLLELGKGFCFEARQFRITTGNRHHRVDLVFYHRLLRCHVLIDLKIRAFKHEDAGQMNFYVNWFKENQMEEGDNPPVGIILCSGKDRTDVEFATAGMDAKLFVSRYLVALPSAAQLKALLEADRARIAQSQH